MDQVKENLQNEIKALQDQIKENEGLLDGADETMKELVEDEIKSLKKQVEDVENSLKQLDQKGGNDDEETGEDGINRNKAVFEIRAGTGGDEATLFAFDLYRMYIRHAELVGWRVAELSKSDSLAGGIKTTTLEIKGKDVYSILRHESGVHRVQRVPSTESSGRIHTSAATVAVLPVVNPVVVEIKPEELKLDFYRSGGSGGQNVNKVSTAVRITHLPTGVVVECQQERTQLKNREKAMGILRSRLFTMMQEERVKNISDLRSGQVGTGDRSEKIRTYNFPQDRITDHRLKKSWGNIEGIMGGKLEKILEETSKLD